MGSLARPETHVVLLALPVFGHVRPPVVLATTLVELGYKVTFVTGTTFKQRVEAIKGVEFYPLKGKANADFEKPLADMFPDRPKENTLIFDMEHIFYSALDDQFETVKELIERPDLRDRPTVIVQDLSYVGTLPMALGSPKIRRVLLIALGHGPLMILSKDTAPPNSGLPSQGQDMNSKMNEGAIEMFSSVSSLQNRLLEPYNCTKPVPSRFLLNNWVEPFDIFCQLCVPTMEFSRSDLPSNVRFCGMLTGHNEANGGGKPRPEWFDDFVLNDTTNRPLVLVSSGSLPGLNVNDLILPTIEACKDLPIRLVVCAVHIEYPAGLELPSNTRWAQWIPFEEILPHTSIVVSSGGYGGVTQAFANGIPMILAGMTEEKRHNGFLAESTGAAINLKTQTPSKEQVRQAVLQIQGDDSYKKKAQELKKACKESNPVGSIVAAIEELSAKFFGGGDGRQAVAGGQDGGV